MSLGERLIAGVCAASGMLASGLAWYGEVAIARIWVEPLAVGMLFGALAAMARTRLAIAIAGLVATAICLVPAIGFFGPFGITVAPLAAVSTLTGFGLGRRTRAVGAVPVLLAVWVVGVGMVASGLAGGIGAYLVLTSFTVGLAVLCLGLRGPIRLSGLVIIACGIGKVTLLRGKDWNVFTGSVIAVCAVAALGARDISRTAEEPWLGGGSTKPLGRW